MSDDDIRILVKEWLQSQNRKSYQLAEEIGLRPQTFYAQMSVRKISANTKKALSRIIPGLISDSESNPLSNTEGCDPKKIRIKEWLRAHGKTRQWLAEQCRVSVRTVHTWFTARGNIPVTQYLFIDKLMSEGESLKTQLPNTIPVNFPATEMEIVHKFQKLHPDIDLPMYGMHKILELCVNVLTQDEYSKTSPYSRTTSTGNIPHRRMKRGTDGGRSGQYEILSRNRGRKNSIREFENCGWMHEDGGNFLFVRKTGFWFQKAIFVIH